MVLSAQDQSGPSSSAANTNSASSNGANTDHHNTTVSLSNPSSATKELLEQLKPNQCDPSIHHESDCAISRCGNMGPSKTQEAASSKRLTDELMSMIKSDNFDPTSLSNDQFVDIIISHQISIHRLEGLLGKRVSPRRCVDIRRLYYKRELDLLDRLEQSCDLQACQKQALDQDQRAGILNRPQTGEFAYDRVVGACCENVVGCVRLPVGLVGPLKLDGQTVYVPLATTEGCLVASTSRGLSALTKSGGVISRIRKNCMTRAPIVRFQDTDLTDALSNVDKAIDWLQDPKNKESIKAAFQSTSRHTKLLDYTLHPIGRELHIRFEAQTGDAMGMNMCSKGTESALKELQRIFPTMDILTLSGNMCTDKKPSAINWSYGRGKSVECNALLTADVVEKVLKVPVDSLIEVWVKKVMVGSAMAGSIGGFNCHAANIVSAIFIATGQDAAQVVSSSNCLLSLEKDSQGSLAVHCSMPSIECGTVGGGTILPDQSGYLQLMAIRGSSDNQFLSRSKNSPTDSDSNACKLARIICATVMAAELSLLASLTEGTLVRSHMTHNRSSQPCKVV